MEPKVVDLGLCMARIHSDDNAWPSSAHALLIVMPEVEGGASQSVVIHGRENIMKLRDALVSQYPLGVAEPVRAALDTTVRERGEK